MLKKSLIAIAVLAIAMPSFAALTNINGDTPPAVEGYDNTDGDHGFKVHGWPCEYQRVQVGKPIEVKVKIGYYIWLKVDKAITLTQAGDWGWYQGCNKFDLKNNFNAQLSAKVSAVNGLASNLSYGLAIDASAPDYTTQTVNVPASTGTKKLQVCVKGKVDIVKLVAGETKQVAEVKVYAMPTAPCSDCMD